jgi:2,4-dienoyl-CoA reductase-like NADH-dependent reductase (Old Yellow Enzyme family)
LYFAFIFSIDIVSISSHSLIFKPTAMPSARYKSSITDASPLGKPLKFEFSGRTVKNRFLKAAMTEQLSSLDPEDFKARGIPSKNLINIYKRWGRGEFGQILTGNIMTNYNQLEAAGNPILSRDTGFEGVRFGAFAELARVAKAHESLVVGKVSHLGRQVVENINAGPIPTSDVQLEGVSSDILPLV